MPYFQSEGFEIAYDIHGEGQPILLIHGFGSNGRVNWVSTGWVDTLMQAGYQVITIDNRGHGASEKIYDEAAYPAREMAKDASNLITHLSLGSVPVMGYSMGARISTFLALDHPERVKALIIGGLGENMLKGFRDAEPIVEALLAPSLEDVTTDVGRMFRQFGERTKSDLKALAACMASSREKITPEQIAQIDAPVLVAVGELDDVGGAAAPLAELLPHGKALVMEGRDHMNATGDKKFKSGVIEFLSQLTA